MMKVMAKEAILTYKRGKGVKLPSRVCSEASAVYQIACDLGHTYQVQESVWVYAFDVRKKLIGFCEVSRGGIANCPVDPRVVFSFLLSASAESWILAHNHPSGDVSPSVEDNHLTNACKKASQVLGLSLLDHVILGDEAYYSYLEHRGL